jgi:polysaccharide biosynthesis transport protein
MLESTIALKQLEKDLLASRIEIVNTEISKNEMDLTAFPLINSKIVNLQKYRDSIQDMLRILFKQQNEFDLTDINNKTQRSMELISPAVIPKEPVAPRRIMQTMIVFFMSIVVSIGLAYLLEMTSGVFETSHAIESTLDTKVIAIIRQAKK